MPEDAHNETRSETMLYCVEWKYGTNVVEASNPDDAVAAARVARRAALGLATDAPLTVIPLVSVTPETVEAM